jgi:hypothetical protein
LLLLALLWPGSLLLPLMLLLLWSGSWLLLLSGSRLVQELCLDT